MSLLTTEVLQSSALEAIKKLHPRTQWRNPVMAVTCTGAALTSALALRDIAVPVPDGAGAGDPAWFAAAISLWLWSTVLFANFAEAVAEGRGKAQAATLRKMRTEVTARRLRDGSAADRPGGAPVVSPAGSADEEQVSAGGLRRGDTVRCGPGDIIPADGEVIAGAASVDESAITGESAPVIRESGGDRSAVTGGTRVLSDGVLVRISADPGSGFLDRMIALVEGASRKKTPNEIALHILLVGLTLIFLAAVVTLLPAAAYAGAQVPVVTAVALLVCLIPTTIGGLLSAIGIAGLDRLVSRNVIALSGRAVEAAGDVDVLLMDKTGTITLGNRQARAFIPAPGVAPEQLADIARRCSLADETPEGRSIVALADQQRRAAGAGPDAAEAGAAGAAGAVYIQFSASTRMSGCDIGGRMLRKGAADAIQRHIAASGGTLPAPVLAAVREVAEGGGTPLVVADGARAMGVVALSDVVKAGIRERFARFRAMGIRTVMITGDNPATAQAIAREAGVDDFIAEATPEMKMERIRAEQRQGHLVAMTGDGTNDAPALAQADVGVAMATGTQAAREAGNMVDLDSNPTKLLEIVEVGKQLLMTRGALTTFSIANDVAKYFAILPALFVPVFPGLAALDVMSLHSPASAILSAVVFNALIIVALIPLALRGVAWRPVGAAALLSRNLLIYGVGGLVAPFIGIKALDVVIAALLF